MVRPVQTTALPLGTIAKEAHVACERATWDALVNTLSAAAPDEACAFVLTRPSRGVDRTTVLLRDIIWARPGEVRATPQSLDISAAYISRALDTAIDAGPLVGVALVHTHPRIGGQEGVARFSPRDDWYDMRLYPTLTNGRPNAICAGIVVGSAPGRVDARLWWDDGAGLRFQAANVVRIVGPELTLLETPYSQWADHLDPDVMDRSTRLWGAQGRRILQNVRVGVAGGGGTGSSIILSLATMGVGRLRGWDRDRVAKENLHRNLGSTQAHVGAYKIQALAQIARQVATAAPFQIEPIPDWATSEANLIALKDCDIVFSCVDKLAPRVPLNDIAYAHLIPIIDMGSRVYHSKGQVTDLLSHAHVLSPGIPCAWCAGTLSSYRLMREAQGNQQGIEERAPYGLPLDATDGVEPSVLCAFG